MWTARTVSPAGILLLMAACSSYSETPTKKSSTGGRTGTGSGATGTGSGAAGNATGAAGRGTAGRGATTGSGATGTGATGTGSTGNGVGGTLGQSSGGSNATPGSGGSGLMSSAGGARTGSGGSNANGGACADVTTTTEALPPVLEIAIDISGSMGDDAYPTDSSNNATKWAEMQRVLPGAFADLPNNWAVGLTFWNRPSGCYAGRQAVPIAPLTAQQLTALDSAVRAQRPTGYTPTIAAWRFALSQLQAWTPPPGYEQSPRYIVLITDGVPTVIENGCDIQNPITQAEYDRWIPMVAAEGNAAGIDTFVVGVLGSEDPQGATYDPMYMLSRWALAGNTPQPAGCVPTTGQVSGGNAVNPRGSYCHFDMTSNPDFAGGLTAALQAIANQVISCSYTVPPPPLGMIIDPLGITVTYTPGGGTPRTLNKASSSACLDGQWFVVSQDSGGMPTQLDLCPSTCDTVSNDPAAQMPVTFKCIGQL
jgi:hypothetical protein